MLRSVLVAIFYLATTVPRSVLAEGFDHSGWNRLVHAHVETVDGGKATVVDYQGMAHDRPQLDVYLCALAEVTVGEFDSWSNQEQLAFLINAYNAWIVDLILGAWPDLESIKDLGGFLRSPWRRAFIPLLGKTRSLDDIEHHLIRASQRYNDPRIHFALNCASIGCPGLRPEAYVAARLDAQLDNQVVLFLSDRKRNRLMGDTLALSSIFKWYRDDFERGWRGYDSLAAFLADYGQALSLTPTAQQRLTNATIEIRFLDYDWRLNAKR